MQLFDQLAHFKPLFVAAKAGVVQYRAANSMGAMPTRKPLPVTHVLLHGIGSGSANWVHQFTQTAAATHAPIRVLAWDAPGYGGSDALPMAAPAARDYSLQVWAWLDAVHSADGLMGKPAEPITLVGHSLGCLMAASAAWLQPSRVKQLILLAPAQGYARGEAAVRAKKLNDRLDTLARLGPEQMAQTRGAAMLSPTASLEQIAFVQSTMAQINRHGYTQAARMLATGDLLTDLAGIRCPIIIASGSADSITPPEACIAAAAHAGAPYVSLPGAGHACAIEAADAVNRLLGLGASREVKR
jgi:pimeloyl-ACP methyl ester carboxylesterase